MLKRHSSLFLFVLVLGLAALTVAATANNSGSRNAEPGTNSHSFCPMISDTDSSEDSSSTGMCHMMDGNMPESCPMNASDCASTACPMGGESLDGPQHMHGMDMMNHGDMDMTGDTDHLYACPMHPDETSNDPDSGCSICGMNLVEVDPSIENETNE